MIFEFESYNDEPRPGALVMVRLHPPEYEQLTAEFEAEERATSGAVES